MFQPSLCYWVLGSTGRCHHELLQLMGAPAYATGCSAAQAGATMSCSKSTNALASACLAASFDLKCPGNAIAHMAPDFVTTNGIKCRTCDGGVIDVTVKDPRANSVAVSFAFGDLQDDSSSPGFP